MSDVSGNAVEVSQCPLFIPSGVGMDIDLEDLDARYVRITPEDAEAEWTSTYTLAETHCIHGPGCKQGGAACPIGRRITRVTILTGSVVRIWGALEAVLARHEHHLSRADKSLRVVRVELSGGGGGQTVQDEGRSPAASPLGKSPLPGQPPQVKGEGAPSAGPRPSAGDMGSRGHLVGVRFPGPLLPEVVQILAMQHQQLLMQQQNIGAWAGAAMTQQQHGIGAKRPGGGGRTEGSSVPQQLKVQAPTPVDSKALAKCFRPPITIQSYFRKQEESVDLERGQGEGGTRMSQKGRGPKSTAITSGKKLQPAASQQQQQQERKPAAIEARIEAGGKASRPPSSQFFAARPPPTRRPTQLAVVDLANDSSEDEGAVRALRGKRRRDILEEGVPIEPQVIEEEDLDIVGSSHGKKSDPPGGRGMSEGYEEEEEEEPLMGAQRITSGTSGQALSEAQQQQPQQRQILQYNQRMKHRGPQTAIPKREKLKIMAEMGVSDLNQANKALFLAHGDVNRAIDLCFMEGV